jgi:hypothetical protein
LTEGQLFETEIFWRPQNKEQSSQIREMFGWEMTTASGQGEGGVLTQFHREDQRVGTLAAEFNGQRPSLNLLQVPSPESVRFKALSQG